MKKNIIFIILILSINIAKSQYLPTPTIQYITVNHSSGKPQIFWTDSNSDNVTGYKIKRFIYSFTGLEDNTIHTISTIENNTQTSYLDISTVYGEAKPNERVEKYYLMSYKIINSSTTKISLLSEMHKTIFLQKNYNFCEQNNKLTWTKYIGWGNNFQKYRIYAKTESTNFQLIGETNITDTIFTHTNLLPNEKYTYFVEAYKSENLISQSNIIEIETQEPKVPDFLNVDSVCVVKNSLKINFTVDNIPEVKQYKLYRSSGNSDFSVIQSFENINSNKIAFIDEDFVAENKYYYYLVSTNSCDKENLFSKTVSNIVVEAVSEKNTNKLQISSENNSEFNIFCSVDNSTFNEIDNTFSKTYSHEISQIRNSQYEEGVSEGNFCYFIENIENNTFFRSNLSCCKQETNIFIPNAFNPKSSIEENRVFKPKISFVEDYTLTIYSRWGNIIFESTNPNSAWNGENSSGKLQPAGSYPYFIQYKTKSGKYFQKKGYINLVW